MDLKNKYNLIIFKNINELNKFILEIFINKRKNDKKIIISWGKSLKSFFYMLSKKFIELDNKIIFLSDERLVPINNKLSNKHKILNKLNIKKNLLAKNIISIPYHFEDISRKQLLNEIEEKIILYNEIDTGILSVASDGHIASILNKKKIIKYYSKNLYIVKSEDENFERISFKLEFISQLDLVILIIIGKDKSNLLKKLIYDVDVKNNEPYIKLIKKSKNKILILTNKQCYNSI